MSNKYCVYMHVFPNGKRYIGITGESPKRRWKRGKNYRSNIYLTRAIQKYGWDNIEHAIVKDGLSQEEAEAEEIRLIAYFNSNKPAYGYNITSGGECIGKHSIETRQKISESHKRLWTDPEYKKRMSESHTGNVPYNKGVSMSKEQKEKISLAKKGCEGHGKKKVLCIDTGTIFTSLSEASRETGISAGRISDVCNGHRHTTGGYRWKYMEG